MATYEYICELGHNVIIERPMTVEEGDPTCTAPLCDAQLKRVWSAAPTIFKGRGFYSTGG